MSRLDPKCPKCGYESVYMRYDGWRTEKKLSLRCKRCENHWYEEALDEEVKDE